MKKVYKIQGISTKPDRALGTASGQSITSFIIAETPEEALAESRLTDPVVVSINELGPHWN